MSADEAKTAFSPPDVKVTRKARLASVEAKKRELPSLEKELEVFEELAADVGAFGDEYDPVLRIEAAMHYVTDPALKSPRELANVEKFAHVPLDVLDGWARQDSWNTKRAGFMKKWAEQARKALGSRLNQLRIESLERLEEVQSMALDKLRNEELLPKSWEGVAGALIALSKTIEKTRESIAKDVLPEASATPVVESTVSKEEAAAVAKALLEARRKALRAQLSEQDTVQIPAANAEPARASDSSEEEE